MSNWLTYSPTSGHGNTQITLSATTLTELEDRVATLIATGSQGGQTLSATTVITQKYLTLTEIYFKNLTWVTDISATGGTATKDNCTYAIFAKYSDGSEEDVTNKATISGSLVVSATTATARQSVGTLTLTATYEGKTCNGSVTAYQEAPSLSEIFFNNLEWAIDISATGGTATKYNCSYTIIAKYSNNVQVDVTSEATVSGSLVVPISTKLTRQVVGTLSLTAEYQGKTCTGNVTAYQEAPSLSEIFFNNLEWVTDVSGTGGTATSANCSFSIIAKYSNNVQVDVTSEAEVTGSLVVEYSIIEERHSAGTLMLTAKYENLTCFGSVDAYQEANYRDYLKFTFVSGGTWTYYNGEGFDIEYSVNDGSWQASEIGAEHTTTVSVSSGDTIRVRGTNATYSPLGLGGSESSKGRFGGTSYYNLSGNIVALCGGVNYESVTALTGGQAFAEIFKNSNIISAGDLIIPSSVTMTGECYAGLFVGCTSLTTAPELPATTLAPYCYSDMFDGCSSLTTAPELPAATLARYCYYNMFKGCTSLTKAPKLPATTLAEECYANMFQGCSSLTTAPELPAATLARYCYYSMFKGCTSLTKAPSILPAMALVSSCYESMFRGCTSLTTAPELPATTLEPYCYRSMFYGCSSLVTAPSILPATTLAQYCYMDMFADCSSLNYIKCLATDIYAYGCTSAWVYGVAPTGTFVKNSDMNDWTTGDSGIPSGWTVIDAT